MTKRGLDVLLAVLGLLVATPLFALIALAIKLDSPGDVLFSQRRLGKKGIPFLLHKFRKFPDNWRDAGPGVTVAGDARMTRVGRFLERTKLDELPQLWNILRGEMSFVGPRPESMRYAHLLAGELSAVLEYTPGIFGPNQIAFRNESEMYPPDQDPEVYYQRVLFPHKARADIAYFRTATFVSDLGLIVRGLWISLAGAIDWRRKLGLHGQILACDLVAIETAWLLANLVRFEGWPPDTHWSVFVTGLWLLPAILFPLMVFGGVYRHPVRHFALTDALRLMTVSMTGWSLGYLTMIGLWYRNSSFFLAPFGFLLALSIMGTVRLWWRESWRKSNRKVNPNRQVRILIYGAGCRGSMLASFLDNGFDNARVLGFLDDDGDLRGRVILGHKVFGSERDLGTVHAVLGIGALWTTFEPDKHKHHRLADWCRANGVQLVVIPTTAPFSGLCRPVEKHAPSDLVGHARPRKDPVAGDSISRGEPAEKPLRPLS